MRTYCYLQVHIETITEENLEYGVEHTIVINCCERHSRQIKIFTFASNFCERDAGYSAIISVKSASELLQRTSVQAFHTKNCNSLLFTDRIQGRNMGISFLFRTSVYAKRLANLHCRLDKEISGSIIFLLKTQPINFY